MQRSREILSTVNGGQPNESTQRRLNAIHAQEQEILDFASLGELTDGRSFDPPFMNSDILKRITGGIVGSIMTEYIVGFVPDAPMGTPAKHKLMVKLASKQIGKLSGGPGKLCISRQIFDCVT